MKRILITTTLAAVALLAILTATTFAFSSGGGPDAGALDAANQLYEAGHFAEAAQMYEQLAAQGIADSSLFYNLGNAYYQQGQVTQAVVNYQRAARLAPRDADIQANLALALSQSSAGISTPSGRMGALAALTKPWLTLDELAILALGLWFGVGFLILSWRMIQPGRLRSLLRYATVITLLLVILSLLALGSRVVSESTQPIIFTMESQLADILSPGT